MKRNVVAMSYSGKNTNVSERDWVRFEVEGGYVDVTYEDGRLAIRGSEAILIGVSTSNIVYISIE